MMEREWHQEVFSGLSLVRRALKRPIRLGAVVGPASGSGLPDRLMQRWIRRRMLSNLRCDEALCHPRARFIGVKLMDYNIVWHDAIMTAFGGGKTVLLTRRPVPQCESLMRSGRTLEQACAKYNDVSGRMTEIAARSGTLVLPFDAFLEDPQARMFHAFKELGLTPPSAYFAKAKPYGKNRMPGTSVADKTVHEVAPSELNDFVDPKVDEAAAQRLTEAQRREIVARTAAAAERLGYAVPR